MQLRSLALWFALLASLAACTETGTRPDGSTPGPDGSTPIPTGDLRIEPLDREETINGAPVVIDYRAFLRDESGAEREVTNEATWYALVPALGSFTGAKFTSAVDRGGTTQIRATLGGDEARTNLTLRLVTTVVTPGTPPDAPTRFGGTVDPAAAPEIVYPVENTMVPPNLGELEIHFMPNGGNLFELRVQTAAVDARIYFGCGEAIGGGCVYTPERDVWDLISTAARGGDATYVLRSVDAAGRLGESAVRRITVAQDDITGGLYYWNAGGGTIDRFEFGVRGAVAEKFIDQPRASAGICVGCHTLSRDGRRIAIGTDIPGSTFQVFDVATRTRQFQLPPAGIASQPNFASFNADATQLVTSSNAGLVLRNLVDGAPIGATITTGGSAMPDWSADGQHIVYVKHPAPPFPADVPGVSSGTISRLDWNGSSWQPGADLVTGGGNNYYPAYSPDSQWIVFNRSPSNVNSMGPEDDGSGSMMTGGVPDAQLWVIRSDGTAAAQQLTIAGGLSDSWPKWDPTSYRHGGMPQFWFAWSSRRAFGLRYGANARVQLWMSAFQPHVAPGAEPARPAFRLPFQNIETGNHIAQWVTSIERMTCSTNADCPGEFCVAGRCFAEEPIM